MTTKPEIAFPVQRGKTTTGFKVQRALPCMRRRNERRPGTFCLVWGCLAAYGQATAVSRRGVSWAFSIGCTEHRTRRELTLGALYCDDTPNGQFEYYFCSTSCLQLLNSCVDELERVVARVRPNPSLKLTRYGRRCKPGPRRMASSRTSLHACLRGQPARTLGRRFHAHCTPTAIAALAHHQNLR